MRKRSGTYVPPTSNSPRIKQSNPFESCPVLVFLSCIPMALIFHLANASPQFPLLLPPSSEGI